MQKYRVILDKFSFATDEIAAREDPAWSCGPSGAQFENYLQSFESVAAGTRFASIHAVVNGLLFKQVVRVRDYIIVLLTHVLFVNDCHHLAALSELFTKTRISLD